MGLIEYVEPVSIGEIFMGIGSLVITLVFAFIFYRLYIRIAHWLDSNINKDIKYSLLEEHQLDKIANKNGLDLDQILIKRKLDIEKNKSFRKKLEEQVFNEMFEKSKK